MSTLLLSENHLTNKGALAFWMVFQDRVVVAEYVNNLFPRTREMLNNTERIDTVLLSKNKIMNKGIALLCDALESNAECALTHLDITHNDLSDPATKFLVNALPHNVLLEWESGNEFTDKGKLQFQRWAEHGKLIETGTVPYAHFKLHLCGDQGAGKTMLRKALSRESDSYAMGFGKCAEAVAKDEPDKVTERTIGMQTVCTKLGAIELCICDYGGQPDFHFQHSWFLPSLNGLYAIVVNLQHSIQKQRGQILYWLRFIQACCSGSAHVVLVGSRADSVQDRSTARQKLEQLEQEIYRKLSAGIPNLVLERTVFAVHCRRAQDAGTASLKSWLHTHCKQELAQMGAVRMPKICKDIRDILPTIRRAQPVMSWSEYERWVKTEIRHNALALHLILEASNYLHDLGEIVFVDKGSLQHWVFLDPPVLCERLLGKVLCPEWINGKPPLSVCSSAEEVASHIEWTDCNGDCSVLMQLLEEFGVCLGFNAQQQEDGKQEEEVGDDLAAADPRKYFFPAFFPSDSSGTVTHGGTCGPALKYCCSVV